MSCKDYKHRPLLTYLDNFTDYNRKLHSFVSVLNGVVILDKIQPGVSLFTMIMAKDKRTKLWGSDMLQHNSDHTCEYFKDISNLNL